MAIRALKAVFHRGAIDADGKTGDGAGIRVDVPQDFFRDAVRGMGHTIANDKQICVGQIFLPRTDLAAQEKARSIIETEVVRFGFYIYGWRQPPIDTSVIGMKANATRPEIEQILFTDQLRRDPPELERALYICRRRIENARARPNLDLYLCSFSAARPHLQGHVPRRGHRQLLSRPQGPALRLGGRRSITSAIRPTPSRNGGWPSPSACSRTMARSTPSRATSTG